METKRCIACKSVKTIDCFHPRKERNGRPRSKCKDCERVLNRAWQTRNRERVNATMRKSYWKNPQRSIEYSRKWRANNPEKKRAQARREMLKVKLHPERLMLLKLRQRINKALRGNWKAGHTVELLGCSIADFKIYLESLWQPEMSWDNYGRHGWHIDHIMPCAIFDLTKPEHQKRCFHFSNLQPLWESENCRKQHRNCIALGKSVR